MSGQIDELKSALKKKKVSFGKQPETEPLIASSSKIDYDTFSVAELEARVRAAEAEEALHRVKQEGEEALRKAKWQADEVAAEAARKAKRDAEEAEAAALAARARALALGAAALALVVVVLAGIAVAGAVSLVGPPELSARIWGPAVLVSLAAYLLVIAWMLLEPATGLLSQPSSE